MVAIKKPKTPHRPMASFVSIIFSQKKKKTALDKKNCMKSIQSEFPFLYLTPLMKLGHLIQKAL